MKTRKLLYLLAGIFNCVVGGFGFLLGGLIFLLKGFLRKIYDASAEMVDGFIKSLAESDPSYEYLLDYSHEEAVNYIMKFMNIVAIVLLVLGLIWITFGILNLLLRRRHQYVFSNRKYLKVLFIVGTWVLLILNVANILTTVAVFMKVKEDEENLKLYVSE